MSDHKPIPHEDFEPAHNCGDEAKEQAKGLLAAPTCSVTTDEGKVIASLLELYEAAWASGNHRIHCECQFCEALETAGENDFRLFDSLKSRFSPNFSVDEKGKS